MLEMLDLLLKGVNLLSGWSQEKKRDRREEFDQYVRPTYETAEVIYRDYRSMLLKLQVMVEKVDDPRRIVRFLIRRREALKPARDLVSALVAKRVSERRGRRFEAGVLGLIAGAMTSVDAPYLEVLDFDRHKGYVRAQVRHHTLLDIVQVLTRTDDFDSNRDLARQTVEYKLASIEDAWQNVVRGYAELHAATFSGARALEETRLSEAEAIAEIRRLLAHVCATASPHWKWPGEKYDRNAAEKIEAIAAAAVPDVLWYARQFREIVHDLADKEPNVKPKHMKRSAAALERALEAIAQQPHPSLPSRANRNRDATRMTRS
jgi:hypothetical protein